MSVKVLYRASGSKKNPECIMLAFGDITLYNRHFAMIGWPSIRHEQLLSRDIQEGEEKNWYFNKTFRFRYFRYYSWKGLIEDETALGVDAVYLKKLVQLSEQYPVTADSLKRQEEIDQKNAERFKVVEPVEEKPTFQPQQLEMF